jgi:hypothetical protein
VKLFNFFNSSMQLATLVLVCYNGGYMLTRVIHCDFPNFCEITTSHRDSFIHTKLTFSLIFYKVYRSRTRIK